jgi:uncharacterized protein YjiS (DUF1127 family)
MTAPVAKADLASVVSGRMSLAAPASRRGPRALLLAALRWLAWLPRRRAVLDDLNSLTEHQLADIGLSRADIHRVFDPRFAAAPRRAGKVI